VATPLEWEELDDSHLSSGKYDIRSIHIRLEKKGDPWKDIERHAGSVREAMMRARR
jgi:bifunctional non-homologous end joining protein LigD